MSFYHYTSRLGAQDIICQRVLLPGQSGLIYPTDTRYASGVEAANLLAITGKPVEMAVELGDDVAALSGPSTARLVRDRSGRIARRGGGREYVSGNAIAMAGGCSHRLVYTGVAMSEWDVRAGEAAVDSHPLRLPEPLERGITMGLEDFARGVGAELTALYHNVSLWFVTREEGDLSRRLQIAAYGIWPFGELRIIPDLYVLDRAKRVMRVMPQIPSRLIESLPLPSLFGTELTQGKALPEVIGRLAASAWKSAESLTEEDVSEEIPVA